MIKTTIRGIVSVVLAALSASAIMYDGDLLAALVFGIPAYLIWPKAKRQEVTP
jgi:hypothetical protein